MEQNNLKEPSHEQERKTTTKMIIVICLLIVVGGGVLFYAVLSEFTKADLRGKLAAYEVVNQDLRQQLANVYAARDGIGAIAEQNLDAFGPMVMEWADESGQETLYYCTNLKIWYGVDTESEVFWSDSRDQQHLPSYAESGDYTYYEMAQEEYDDYPRVYALELQSIDDQVCKIEREYKAVADEFYSGDNPDLSQLRSYLAQKAECNITFYNASLAGEQSYENRLHLTYEDVSLPQPQKCSRCACPDCCCSDCQCIPEN